MDDGDAQYSHLELPYIVAGGTGRVGAGVLQDSGIIKLIYNQSFEFLISIYEVCSISILVVIKLGHHWWCWSSWSQGRGFCFLGHVTGVDIMSTGDNVIPHESIQPKRK